MRIAAISDIHSNVFALDAVLHDIAHRSVDVIVNLGDILYGPIAPRATYELLIAQDFVTIRGNQDRQIYEATQNEIDTNPTLQFILEDLGTEPLDWMQFSVIQYIEEFSSAEKTRCDFRESPQIGRAACRGRGLWVCVGVGGVVG